MNGFIASWKTSVSGLALLLIGGAQAIAGWKLPGFSMEPGAAIVMGLGLLAAKDGNVTGGTVPQTGEATTRVPSSINVGFIIFCMLGLTLFANDARAADMPVPMKANAAVNANTVVYDWSGIFFGVNGGGSISKSNLVIDPNLLSDRLPTRAKGGGPYAALTAGINWQNKNVIGGIVADIGWLNAIDRVPCGDTSCAAKTTYSADVIARLGLTSGSLEFTTPAQSPSTRNVWLYGLGGISLRGLRAELGTEQTKATKVGYIVGAGTEIPIGPNLSAAIEWHHLFANKMQHDPVLDTRTSEDRFIARANYKL